VKRVFLFLLVLSMFTAASLPAQTPKIYSGDRVALRPDIPSFVGYVPDEIVVKFNPSYVPDPTRPSLQTGKTGISSVDMVAAKYGAKKLVQMYPGARPKLLGGKVYDLSVWYKMKFAGEVDVEKVVSELKALPEVADAQPIGIHTVYATPNDGYYSNQWHLNQSNDHDIDAPEAWDIETGNSDIIVAILDSGVRYFHKDLGGANASYNDPINVNGNMWINWAEKNGTTGVDDDGNGFVDDWVGWDFVDGASQCWSGEDCNEQDNDPRDFNGHGTHCAGNVGAINNNGYATCAPSGGWGNGSLQATANGVKVMACRIGWSGVYIIWEVGYVRMDFAAEAFYYAADNGARIASCSWGSSNTGGIADAIDYFLAHGGLIFKAAGNDNSQTADYMCGRSDIISVAATDQNDCKADFSNYGTWVDISAPGVGIYSLYHDHSDPQNDYIASMDGTSMATPLAASVAALIWSQNPSWSASQVEQKLYDSADPIDNLSCNSSYAGKLGAGRINAYNAVYGGGGPEAPVADFTGSPTSGCASLTVNFTDQSTGEIDSWSWDFGDGGTSTEQNPSHTYTQAGIYTVKLTVTGPGGSDTETKVDYITVSSAPTASFTGSPTSGNAPLTVNFTDQSTGNPTSWSWDFGDGGTSTEQNPSHTYNDPGTYTVKLTVSNSCGSDTETKVDYITVSGNAPVADFVGSPTSGTAPLTVDFTDQSTGDPTSWLWDFGDGGTSTEQNPTHTYNDTGTYTVKLTVTNDYGSDTETKVDYITVTEPGGNVIGEVGKIVRNQTGDGNDWYTVNLNNSYSNPVVFMKGLSYNGGHPTHLRVRNVTSTSFEWKMEEWDYLDGNHTTETCPYIVVGAGSFTLEDGTRIEAGTFTASTSWQTVNFSQSFSSTPTLLVGVMSDNDDAAVVARTRNLSTSGFQVKLQEEEAADQVHANETIAWVAIGQGSGTNNGIQFLSARTGNSVKNKWYTIDFSPTFSSEPIFLCHDDTYDGGNTCGVRYQNLTGSSVEVKIEEEKSKDTEVSHTTEVVSYLVWAQAGDIVGSLGTFAESEKSDLTPVVDGTRNNLIAQKAPEAFALEQNYPNPFNPVTVIRFSLEKPGYTRLEVFNVAGQLVATLVDGELPAGEHEVTWNAAGHASGVYFYRLTSGSKRITRRMILLH